MTDEETTLEGGAKKKDEYLSVIWNPFKTKQYIITMCILQIGASVAQRYDVCFSTYAE